VRSGNTALHMCVFHNQPAMYEYLVMTCGANEYLRNNDGLTPLVLAASINSPDMFQEICRRRRRIGWQYGPVRSCPPSCLRVSAFY
jgi:ankyrin repeat protein